MSSHDRTSTSRRWRWRHALCCSSGGESTLGTAIGGASGDPPRSSDRRPDRPDRLGGALDQDRVLAVDLLELDPDDLLARCRYVLADVIGPDGQLAMAAIDEDGEPDGLGSSEIDERVHRR